MLALYILYIASYGQLIITLSAKKYFIWVREIARSTYVVQLFQVIFQNSGISIFIIRSLPHLSSSRGHIARV